MAQTLESTATQSPRIIAYFAFFGAVPSTICPSCFCEAPDTIENSQAIYSYDELSTDTYCEVCERDL